MNALIAGGMKKSVKGVESPDRRPGYFKDEDEQMER